MAANTPSTPWQSQRARIMQQAKHKKNIQRFYCKATSLHILKEKEVRMKSRRKLEKKVRFTLESKKKQIT